MYGVGAPPAEADAVVLSLADLDRAIQDAFNTPNLHGRSDEKEAVKQLMWGVPESLRQQAIEMLSSEHDLHLQPNIPCRIVKALRPCRTCTRMGNLCGCLLPPAAAPTLADVESALFAAWCQPSLMSRADEMAPVLQVVREAPEFLREGIIKFLQQDANLAAQLDLTRFVEAKIYTDITQRYINRKAAERMLGP